MRRTCLHQRRRTGAACVAGAQSKGCITSGCGSAVDQLEHRRHQVRRACVRAPCSRKWAANEQNNTKRLRWSRTPRARITGASWSLARCHAWSGGTVVAARPQRSCAAHAAGNRQHGGFLRVTTGCMICFPVYMPLGGGGSPGFCDSRPSSHSPLSARQSPHR